MDGKTKVAMLTAALCMSGAAASSGDESEFTFRTVRPPSGEGRRITVQITEPLPLPRSYKDSRGSMGAEDRPPPMEIGAFWTLVSPLRDAEGQGDERLARAVTALTAATDAPVGPPADALRAIARRHGDHIRAAAEGGRVSPALALAVIAVESSGRTDAVSHAGATGLMQLMPATAARFGVRDALQPAENVAGGIAYLDWLLTRFGGDPILALAAYNAGEGAVDAHFGVPPYAETRAYVPKVVAAWKVARTLCAVPPDGPRSPCEFVETS